MLAPATATVVFAPPVTRTFSIFPVSTRIIVVEFKHRTDQGLAGCTIAGALKVPSGEVITKSVSLASPLIRMVSPFFLVIPMKENQSPATPALRSLRVLAVQPDAEHRHQKVRRRLHGCHVSGALHHIGISADLAKFRMLHLIV